MFWINKGVVRASAGSSTAGFIGDRAFEIVEDQAALAVADAQQQAGGGGSRGLDEDGDVLGGGRAAEALQKQQLAVIEDFTCGMLQRDAMPLDRIHQMPRQLVDGSGTGSGSSELKFDMSLMQLQHFLNGLIDRGKLEEVDRLYSVRKG
jgi:hypothetical protein